MAKKVFISYSWDSEEHKEWVASLCNELRTIYGIEATVDNFLNISNLNKMMVQEISSNDKIVIIVTKKYTEKANTFSGGVGYETELLLNYINTNPNKTIVALREKCDKPFYLQGYYHIDFTNNQNNTKAIEELVLKIKDQPNYEIGKVNTNNPKKVKSRQVKSFIEETEEEQIDKIEKHLSSITGYSFSPQGRINCSKWIKEFGYDIVVESINIAMSQYLRMNTEGKYTKESIELVFNKIGGICYNKFEEKTKPYIAGTKRVINYCKKKFSYISWSREKYLESEIGTILYDSYKQGSYSETLEDIMQLVRTALSLSDFVENMEDSLGEKNV